jgi:ABC-type glycerol-3-phosphate transport system substrate-binding protein
MHQIIIKCRGRTMSSLLALALLVACVGLAACGSSSNDSSNTPASTAATTHTTTTITKDYRRKLIALASCMRRNGINVPPEPDAYGKFDVRGINMNTPKYKAALRQCFR